jgi:hypothetical protein
MDVDADNVMVGKRRLREVLEREAMRYAETRNWRDPTLRQKNEMIEEALAEIAAVRHRFEHKEYVGAYPPRVWSRTPSRRWPRSMMTSAPRW